MNLIVAEKNNLTPSQNELIGAISGNQVNNIHLEDAKERIVDLVKKAIAETGFKMDIIDMDVLAMGVVTDVFSDFPLFTLQEIALAFRMGVREKFGKYMGLSIKTFYSWLVDFKKWKEEQIHDVKKVLQLPAPEMTNEDKEKARKGFVERILQVFENYKSRPSEKIIDGGNLIYLTLRDQYDLITIETPRKLQLIEEAKQILVKEKRVEKNTLKREFKEDISSVASDVIDSRFKKEIIGILKSEGDEVVIREAMNLTLKEQFDFWLMTDVDVPLLIFEKEKEYQQNNVNKK